MLKQTYTHTSMHEAQNFSSWMLSEQLQHVYSNDSKPLAFWNLSLFEYHSSTRCLSHCLSLSLSLLRSGPNSSISFSWLVCLFTCLFIAFFQLNQTHNDKQKTCSDTNAQIFFLKKKKGTIKCAHFQNMF